MKDKIIYYSDLKNQDFSGTNIVVKPLPDNYQYIKKNIFWKIWEIFIYYLVAKPILTIIVKIRWHHKFINKKVIKKVKKSGAILYGNHTTKLADAFVPHMLVYRKNYIIASPETMSLPFLKNLLNALGVIPLTDKLSLKKKLLQAIKYHLSKGNFLTIYPEAHIWPFYTKIRPFDSTSFKYAAIFNVPVFALTTCYQKRRFRKFPKIVTTVDGPYYPKEELNNNENAAYLRDLVYNKMVERANLYSTYEYVKYVYQPKEKESTDY